MPRTSLEQVPDSPARAYYREADDSLARSFDRRRGPRPLSPRRNSTRAQRLDWEALEPHGAYARWGKPVLRVVLLFVSVPPALLVGLGIAVINAVIFGSVRRVFFKQTRVGYRGRIFQIYKFRTLKDCGCDDFDAWSEGSDRSRVTRFGQLLRTTHLDELPQLWNIVRGEMDFIGPRPEMLAIDRWACERIPRFPERNALLPGVTGLAQVTYGYAPRDPAAYARKLSADQFYRRNLSLRQDLSILARTLVWMVRGRGWGLPVSRDAPEKNRIALALLENPAAPAAPKEHLESSAR